MCQTYDAKFCDQLDYKEINVCELICFYAHCHFARYGCKVLSWLMSISVCVSVSPHNSKNMWPNYGSVHLWRRCDTLCTSGFTDNVMFSYHGTNGRTGMCALPGAGTGGRGRWPGVIRCGPLARRHGWQACCAAAGLGCCWGRWCAFRRVLHAIVAHWSEVSEAWVLCRRLWLLVCLSVCLSVCSCSKRKTCESETRESLGYGYSP